MASEDRKVSCEIKLERLYQEILEQNIKILGVEDDCRGQPGSPVILVLEAVHFKDQACNSLVNKIVDYLTLWNARKLTIKFVENMTVEGGEEFITHLYNAVSNLETLETLEMKDASERSALKASVRRP